MEYLVDNEAKVFIIRRWMLQFYGQKLKSLLETSNEWINKQYNGKKLTREIMLYGNGFIKEYPYDHIKYPIINWNRREQINREIKAVMNAIICDETIIKHLGQVDFNSCVINRYKNGRHFISPHKDIEADGPYNAVITLSLGASRTFILKRDDEVIKTKLHHGDLLVMSLKCQELYEHAIPKEKAAGSRISLTYRFIN